MLHLIDSEIDFPLLETWYKIISSCRIRRGENCSAGRKYNKSSIGKEEILFEVTQNVSGRHRTGLSAFA